MTKQVQRRRGTATQHTSFTGAEGETSVNTTNKSIHVHDGTTTGGFEAARIDLTNVTGATVAGKVTGSTLSSLTITSADINGGTVDNVAIGNTTPSSGLFTTLNASSTLTLGGTAVTSTAAELNILDGVTATAAELNVLDGVTATAAELNLVDGSAAGSVVINKAVIYSATGQVNATQLAIGGTAITSTAAELNFVDGVTSNVQTQINTKAPLASPTFTGGIDVTGAVVADGLTVDGAYSYLNGLRISGVDTGNTIYQPTSDLSISSASGSISLKPSGTNILHATNTGVGIGTSSIGSSTKLQVAGRGLFTDGAIDPADGSPAGVTVGYNIAGDYGFIQSIHTGVANKPLYIQPNGSNVYISPNGGNVGIGTSSPLSRLNAKGTQGNWRVDPDSVSGEIQVFSTTTANDGFIGFRIRTQHTIFDTAGSERMRIDSSGNVGIGTSSPAATLDVRLASDRGLYVEGSTSNPVYLRSYHGSSSSNLREIGLKGSDIRFETGSDAGTSTTEAMRIDSSGNVGIGGTINAGSNVNLTASGAQLTTTYSGVTASRFYTTTSGANISVDGAWPIMFTNNSTERMRIDSSGNVGIGTVAASIYGKNLHVHTAATTGSSLQLTDGTTGSGVNDGLQIICTNGLSYIWNREATDMVFATSNLERIRLNAIGNVGIGTSSPTAKIHATTATAGYAAKLINTNGASDSNGLLIQAGTGASEYNLNLTNTAGTTNFLVVKGNGNVGIGTSSPSAMLHVQSTLGITTARLEQAGNVGGILIGYGGASANYYDADNHYFRSGNSASNKMTIDSSGNLLVGTTVARTGTASISIEGGNVYQQFRAAGTGGLQQVSFVRNTAVTPAEVGYISTTGTATTYATSSDYRLKTDAQPMVGASARVLALKPVNFEWISDGSRVDGFLAHEAQAVVPECVTGTKDAMRDEEYEVTAAVYEDIIIAAVLDEEGNELEAERTEQRLVTEAVMGTRSVPDMQGIDQSKLVPLLTAALQEALTKIADMEIRLSALEG